MRVPIVAAWAVTGIDRWSAATFPGCSPSYRRTASTASTSTMMDRIAPRTDPDVGSGGSWLIAGRKVTL